MSNKLLLLLVVFVFVSCSNHNKISHLKLIKAYEIETHNSIEPSGLTEWEGVFYAVSDKHNSIYQLEFDENKVRFKPYIEILSEDNLIFDFEGITHDHDFFYLVSENTFRILKVSKNGEYQEWFPTGNEIEMMGKKAGLFQTDNAYIEGICVLKDNSFLMVAERQPRGFIEYKSSQDIKAYQMNTTPYQLKEQQTPDFAGLSCDKEIYVLDRNANVVSEIKKIDGTYQVVNGYSYNEVINQSEFAFESMVFGMAEGLIVTGNKIYVMLDNNKEHHRNNPESNNSFLFEFTK